MWGPFVQTTWSSVQEPQPQKSGLHASQAVASEGASVAASMPEEPDDPDEPDEPDDPDDPDDPDEPDDPDDPDEPEEPDDPDEPEEPTFAVFPPHAAMMTKTPTPATARLIPRRFMTSRIAVARSRRESSVEVAAT
jgi:hypothetical protein